jgi:hypothetical protein
LNEDPLERLIESFGSVVNLEQLDCGRGRWSDDAMSLYDRMSGMTWEKIADRRNRTMIYWDDLEVYILEYPGGVEIPIWDPGSDFYGTQDYDPKRAARAIRSALRRALKGVKEARPELTLMIEKITREYLSPRESAFMYLPTAKEWIRPGGEHS